MPRKLKLKPPRPVNVELVLSRHQAFKDRLLTTSLLPRLRHLLNKAQAKTKYPLYWSMSMGVDCLYCDAPWQRGSWCTVEYAAPDMTPSPGVAPRVERLREKFPELVEFITVMSTLMSHGLIREDVEPSVPPRPDDGTQDPADYVEKGPYVWCEAKGCRHRETEDDFIVGNDDVRRCGPCARKPENRHHYLSHLHRI